MSSAFADALFRTAVDQLRAQYGRPQFLTVGQTFTLRGLSWRVTYVNDSRAHCETRATHPVTVHDRRTGQDRTFTATTVRYMDISPTTDVSALDDVIGAAQ